MGYRGGSPRSRGTAAALSLGVVVLIALVMLRMGYFEAGVKGDRARITAINISLAGHEAKKATATTVRIKTESAAAPAPAAVRAKPPPPVPIPRKSSEPFKLIELSSADMAAGDISKLSASAGKGEAGAGTGTSKKIYGPGDGPGGAQLFNAEWVREPTRQEIDGYLNAKSAQAEWAMIVCRTVPGNRVEDCQELGESPRGSGLARGLRQAAWQFQVRPPRIDGKPEIGAWVKIRFDFIRNVAR